jgi:hypothetical protein
MGLLKAAELAGASVNCLARNRGHRPMDSESIAGLRRLPPSQTMGDPCFQYIYRVAFGYCREQVLINSAPFKAC